MPNEVHDSSPSDTPVMPPTIDGAPPRLKGNMGVPQLLFMVLAFNAPLGIVAAVVPLVIGLGSGLATPLLYVAFGLVIAVFAVGYAVMSRLLPRAGAFYTFVTAGLGRSMGLAASFIAVLGYTVGLTGTLVYAGITLESVVTRFDGPQVAWWVWSLVVTLGIAVLGFVRIDFSARVLGVLVAVEVAVLLVYDATVVLSGGATGNVTFDSFNPTLLLSGGAAVGLVFAITSFSGFESTAIFRDEVRNPERTIPVATYLAVAVIVVFYCLTSWALIQAYGQDAAVATIATDPTNAFMNSLSQYLGLAVQDIVSVLLLTSIFASLTAFHNVITRYLFNLGADGVLASPLGRPHPRFGSPHRASVTLSLVSLTFVIVVGVAADDAAGRVFAALVGIAGYAVLILICLAAVGIAAYLVRFRPTNASVWHRAIAPVIAAGAMVAVTVLVTMNIDLLTGSSTLSMVAIGLMIGCVVFGVSVARVLRKLRPDIYRRIGTRD